MTAIPMTVHDQDLINKALDCPYTEWEIIDGYIDLARSDEAKKELRHIRNRKHHIEEMKNGNL